MVWGADLTAQAPAEPYMPVWVDLDILYGPAPADAAPPTGDPKRLLVLTGRAVGRLRATRRPGHPCVHAGAGGMDHLPGGAHQARPGAHHSAR